MTASTTDTHRVTNVRLAGIGGMGVLKASWILAEVAFRQGLDVKKSEIHGMSQRGGSVASDVRFGAEVVSPMIPSGEIDYLVLLQEDQAPLHEADLSPEAVVLTPSQIDIDRLATKKALNVAMLGLLSRRLDIPAEAWLEVIRETFPEKTHEANEAAFDLGRQSE